nr:EamA family transporter [Rhizobium sp. L1K21]
MHATWNAIVKNGSNKMLDSSAIALGASLVSIIGLFFLPAPGWQIWPFVIGSTLIHFAYYQLIAAGYHHGGIALVYPLMRGAAPLIVTFAGMTIFGESLHGGALVGIFVISAGVLVMALEARRGGPLAALFALANACVIATYTMVDGYGARIANDPVAYTFWISIFPPIPLYLYAFLKRGRHEVVDHLRHNWWRAIVGGGGSVGAYSLALWAMTKAPVAMVAALRETSILFALLISIFIFREPASKWRYAAGVTIACGALILKLA